MLVHTRPLDKSSHLTNMFEVKTICVLASPSILTFRSSWRRLFSSFSVIKCLVWISIWFSAHEMHFGRLIVPDIPGQCKCADETLDHFRFHQWRRLAFLSKFDQTNPAWALLTFNLANGHALTYMEGNRILNNTRDYTYPHVMWRTILASIISLSAIYLRGDVSCMLGQVSSCAPPSRTWKSQLRGTCGGSGSFKNLNGQRLFLFQFKTVSSTGLLHPSINCPSYKHLAFIVPVFDRTLSWRLESNQDF